MWSTHYGPDWPPAVTVAGVYSTEYTVLMLGGPMHEMGVEYTEAIAVLLKCISSRMWDCDVSDIADNLLWIAHARRCGTARR